MPVLRIPKVHIDNLIEQVSLAVLTIELAGDDALLGGQVRVAGPTAIHSFVREEKGGVAHTHVVCARRGCEGDTSSLMAQGQQDEGGWEQAGLRG